MFDLEGLDHVALAVTDVEESAKWYIEVLGFERRYQGMWGGIPVFVACGNTAIALFPKAENSHDPSGPRKKLNMLHLAFRANRNNFVAAQQDLKLRGILFHFQDHEVSESIYFRDPAGNSLELATPDMWKS